MKLKKFNEFIKEDLNREFDEMTDDNVDSDENYYDSVEDFKRELGDNDLKEDDFQLSDDDDDDDYDDESLAPVTSDDEYDEEEYEEEDDNLADVTTDEFDGVDDLPASDDTSDLQYEEEEEVHEYEGTKLMKELADKLGEKVVDNQIHYGDKVINYYSETEKFHIGKQKFNTVEEVLDFLSPKEMTDEVENEVVESRRFIKKF